MERYEFGICSWSVLLGLIIRLYLSRERFILGRNVYEDKRTQVPIRLLLMDRSSDQYYHLNYSHVKKAITFAPESCFSRRDSSVAENFQRV
jgi:hypothetical protein